MRSEGVPEEGNEVLLTNITSDKGRDEGHRDYEEKVRQNVREISEYYLQGTFSDVPI